MPTLSIQSPLAANLAALTPRNADVAEKLATVSADLRAVFAQTPDGVPALSVNGVSLCSRHRPLQEARRLVSDIDLVEHAVVVVMGFGPGYHVQELVKRSNKATVILVFEPDMTLLGATLENIDHSSWLRDSLVIFITDPDDRATLGRKLEGAESILAQGVHFLEHPPSRLRLRESSARFVKVFGDFITAAKTTLTTTLMRSVDTVRNLMLNLDHYAAGAGIFDLKDLAVGLPAVVVSAGPSLQKNIHHLARGDVRERCVIVAVQTALKPLLAAGIKPHFVTALDYHEISRRFYEDLNANDLRDVTLIADPKANPVILDVYPGPLRCCASVYLDKLLGPAAREMGTVPAGATVAHLAVYIAKYLGCNPIALIGQDLGFSDGLYYAPGTAIHDVWAPELNPFNTIAMMEWQRIARHRTHLVKLKDVHGKSIYTDAQMQTYLQQFERDFAQYAREGLTIVDATEGGVAKQHTTAMTLAMFLEKHATRALPKIPPPQRGLDSNRLTGARTRVSQVRADVRKLKRVSEQTSRLLRQMIDDQRDTSKMTRHFAQIEKNRRVVEKKFEAFELLNFMNQLGVFRRMKADRRLHMQQTLDPLARQRAQLERDLHNVVWLADAAEEMTNQLATSERVLSGESVATRARAAVDLLKHDVRAINTSPSCVAALIPVDLERNGLGIRRSLAENFRGRTVLQATLERLAQSQALESIVLIAQRGGDIESLIDRGQIHLSLEIEWCEHSPFGPEHEAIAAARLWASTCWRGGIAGMSVYDEVLCPQIMHCVMQKRGLTAALIVGPDWPLVQVTGECGCDAVIRRHREHASQHNLVFTQAPPGLCGCVVSASLMAELAQRNRLATIGGLLVYQPHAPQGDPIARDACVQIDHQVRNSLIRATFDSPRQRAIMNGAMESNPTNSLEWVQSIAACGIAPNHNKLPQLLALELCTDRISAGQFAQRFGANVKRPPMLVDLARKVIDDLAASPDSVLNLAGAGDPLLHPHFDAIIRYAKSQGIRGVHLRTELLCERETIDQLLASGVDVVSIDLNADRAATYEAMMGVNRFRDALENIEYLLDHRRRLTPQNGTSAMALPWVVPTIMRCTETYEDIDTFFDRWQHTLGVAVIADAKKVSGTVSTREKGVRNLSLTSALTPPQVLDRDRRCHMTILCDGSVPVEIDDLDPVQTTGNLAKSALVEIWHHLLNRRETASEVASA